MTTGSIERLKCPACKKEMVTPIFAENVKQATFEIQGRCPHCGVELYFWARREIVVECEVARKVK